MLGPYEHGFPSSHDGSQKMRKNHPNCLRKEYCHGIRLGKGHTDVAKVVKCFGGQFHLEEAGLERLARFRYSLTSFAVSAAQLGGLQFRIAISASTVPTAHRYSSLRYLRRFVGRQRRLPVIVIVSIVLGEFDVV